MPKLSIVVPVYQNENNLNPLYEDLKEKIFDKFDFEYELVMVDDGSNDGSWQVINELAKKDKNIRGYRLSRNFGAQISCFAGLCESTGDCVVIKSADLQEPTEMILEMYQKWKEGYNVIQAVRQNREDKNFFSELYYWLTQKLCFPQMPQHGFECPMLDRKVVDVIKKMKEKDAPIIDQVLWVGYKTAQVFYTRKKRKIGKSKWTLSKKIRMFSDTFFSFSFVPISLITLLGFFSSFFSFIWGLWIVVCKLTGVGNILVSGYASIVAFQLFSFGIIMATLGIIGGYLWRTFNASRKRPVYIIEDICCENDIEKRK